MTGILVKTALAILLMATVLMAAGLIWLAAAEPEVLASAHGQRGWTGLALAVASRALSVLWSAGAVAGPCGRAKGNS